MGTLNSVLILGFRSFLRWTPHPVIVTIRDNRDYIRGGGFMFPRLFRNVGWIGMLITLCRIMYDVPEQHAPDMISLRTTMERRLPCFEVSCTSVHILY